MWARAVWTEGLEEEEGVLPASWIKDREVYWPPGADAKKAMQKMLTPLISWRKFPLVKIKIKSESRSECESHEQTTTVENSDDDEDDDMSKRKRKSTQSTRYPDYVTGHESTDPSTTVISEEKEYEKPPQCSDDITLPVPPKKMKHFDKQSPAIPHSQTHRSPSPVPSRSRSPSKESNKSRSSLKSKYQSRSHSKSNSPLGTSYTSPSRSRSRPKYTSTPITGNESDKRSKTSKRSYSQSKETPKSHQLSKYQSRSPSQRSSYDFLQSSRLRSKSPSRPKHQPQRRDHSIFQTQSRSFSHSHSQSSSGKSRASVIKSLSSKHTGRYSHKDHSISSSRSYHTQRKTRSRTPSHSLSPSLLGRASDISRSGSRPTGRHSHKDHSVSPSRSYHTQSKNKTSSRSRSLSLFSSASDRETSICNSQSQSGSHNQNKSRNPNSSQKSNNKEDKFPMPEGRFQRRVLFLLADIRNDILSLKRERKVNVVEDGANEDRSQAATMEDYMGLVERMKIPDERHKMVQALSAIGGINVRDNVKNILETLMSNELMSRFNMKGNNNKVSFKSSAICGIVIASAMKTNVKEGMTEHEVMLAVQNCLKYAPDRRGGGGRKKATL